MEVVKPAALNSGGKIKWLVMFAWQQVAFLQINEQKSFRQIPDLKLAKSDDGISARNVL